MPLEPESFKLSLNQATRVRKQYRFCVYQADLELRPIKKWPRSER